MLMEHKFPVTIRNTTNSKRIVGGLIFAPNEELVVQKPIYEFSKKELDYSLGMGYLTVVTEEKKKKKDPEVKQNEKVQEVLDDETRARSIVDRFVDKEVHWTAVRKYVDQVTDVKELESLLIDAKFHNLNESSVVVKSIQDRLSILSEQ